MPRSTSPRRLGRVATALATLALVTLAGTSSAAAQEPAPGNAGTVKIHRSTTPDDDRRNEPKVCEFRIVGFGFPDDADLEITIEGHGGPNAGPSSFEGTATVDDEGDFAIAGPTLESGMYKLFVDNTTAPGGSKQKVFKIECPGDQEPQPEELDRTLRLAKAVTGDGDAPDEDFTFDVDCGDAFDDTVMVAAGEVVTVADDLPFGTTCTIEETDDLDADDTTIAVDPTDAEQSRDGQSITVSTVEGSISVTVTFSNRFDADDAVIPEVVPPVVDGESLPAAAEPPAVAAAGAERSRAALPRTGPMSNGPLLALAAGLIGVGAFLQVQSRRRMLGA